MSRPLFLLLIILKAPDTHDKPRSGWWGQGPPRVTSGPKCQAGNPGLGIQGTFRAGPSHLCEPSTLDRAKMSQRKRGWTGGRGKGQLLRPRPPPPANLPLGGGADGSGGSTSSFQRLRFMDVRAGAHPPRLPSWGPRPRKALGAFPGCSTRAFLRGSPPRPAERSPTRQCTESGLGPGSQEALGPGFLLHGWGARGCTGGWSPGLGVCRSPGFDALSTCLRCQCTALQSGDKPRRGGARAGVLTTTAVTGWPGM